MVTLRSGSLELVLEPALGGSVQSFMHNGKNILRPTLPNAQSAADTAAFPLFPYSGRIDRGRFTRGNEEFQLRLNFPPEPHAIHGDAWQSAWAVNESGPNHATLVHIHAGHAEIWRWAYSAKQTFSLSETALTIVLEMTNLAETPMPAGFGWHPYFVREDAALAAPATVVWPVDDHMLPSNPEGLTPWCDLTQSASVDTVQLDNPFTCTERQAGIAWPSRRLSADMRWTAPLDFMVVFSPPGQDFFCVEPVSHIPNSVNSTLPHAQTGHRVLAPGETLSGTITLSVKID